MEAREGVVGQGRAVGEALEGGIEETRVAHVVQAGPHPHRACPRQHPMDPLLRKEITLWGRQGGLLHLVTVILLSPPRRRW